ncbi:MAG: hypothetical protein BGO69_10895 [Bacteroidetes bacterium 46-16]|mgnify:CR=1 FL=1|nr:MAG: hypothetical protein BGO69_10895 [Bacteroidetes bacterium 46-16]
MKVLVTNWVNIVGIFLALLAYTFLNSWINYPATFVQALFGAFLLIILYGIMFWGGFLIAITILDLVLIVPNPKHLKLKLIIEWVVISSPFVYWALKYEDQRVMFLIAVITFLITQLIREKLINKALV